MKFAHLREVLSQSLEAISAEALGFWECYPSVQGAMPRGWVSTPQLFEAEFQKVLLYQVSESVISHGMRGRRWKAERGTLVPEIPWGFVYTGTRG